MLVNSFFYFFEFFSEVFHVIFQGFVISDWRGLDKMTSPEHADYITSVKLGILAGIDMVTSRIAQCAQDILVNSYASFWSRD